MIKWTVIFLLLWALAASALEPSSFTHLEMVPADSLDPAWAYDTVSHNVIFNCYDYLLAPKSSGTVELEPRLADSVPSRANGLISRDGREYSFPIRKGVFFPDGSELGPEDVRYSFLRFMLLDRAGGPSALLLKPLLGRDSTRDAEGRLIDGIYREAARAVRVEEDKVIFRLKRPFAPFLRLLTRWTAVLSKSWCSARGEWDGREESLPKHNNPGRENSALMDRTFGSGPFSVLRWDKAAQSILLARNEAYWRGPAPLYRVMIRVAPEFSLRRMMLAAGDADSIAAAPQYAAQLKGIPGVRVVEHLDTLDLSHILFFNWKIRVADNPWTGSGRLDGAGVPPDFFSDKDVREGFAYALDSAQFVREALRDEGKRASSGIPRVLLSPDPLAPVRDHSPELAQRHLRRAFGGLLWEKGFTLTAAQLPPAEGGDVLLSMLKKTLESLNPRFRLEIRFLSWASLFEQVEKHGLPLVLLGTAAEYADPHPIAYGLLHSAGYYPQAFGYKNSSADRLIDEAAHNGDPVQREDAYRRLQKIEFEDLPYVPIAETSGVRVERDWVRGWRHHPGLPRLPIGADYFTLSKQP